MKQNDSILYLECSMGAAGDMLSAALFELFPETEGYEIAFLLPVGHAAAHAEPSSMHAERKDLASFATQL